MYSLKQMEVSEFTIGEYTFYIKKFPAFYCANISAELTKVVTPVIGGLAPIIGGLNEGFDLSHIKIESAIPAVTQAFAQLDGDQVEHILNRLLIERKNVSLSGPITDGAVKPLTMDVANEVFCGGIDEMFILCWHVINCNFGDFFSKIGARFGLRIGNTETPVQLNSTESST